MAQDNIRGGYGGRGGGGNGGTTQSGYGEESAGGLLGRLIDDVSQLFRNEIALARAEVRESVGKAKAGIGAVAVGGAVLLVGALALVAALILGLAEVVEPWLAALIVGAIFAVVGYVMLQAGKRKLEPSNFAFERTQESLRKDKDTVTRSLQ